MMALFFGHLADPDGEVQRLGKVSKGEQTDQMIDAVFPLHRPMGQLLAPKRTLLGSSPRSVAAAGLTMALVQIHSLFRSRF